MNLRQGQDATGRPVSGRWFEQLPVGTHVQHVTRRTVTETDNVLFTTMTMNPAPMHLDAEYAAVPVPAPSRARGLRAPRVQPA
jgi:acyl dehydratase